MAVGDRIRIVTEKEFRIMSPPRRPRGEKPKITIRYLRRQIANMEISLHQARLAADDKDKVIAGYDVQLSEANDEILHRRRRDTERAIMLGEANAKLRQSTERTAFLEGYYEKSKEATWPAAEPLQAARTSIVGNPAEAHTGERPRDTQNLQDGGQTQPGARRHEGAARAGAAIGDEIPRVRRDDPSYSKGRPVEHVEITEARDGEPRYHPGDIEWMV